jgi:protease I
MHKVLMPIGDAAEVLDTLYAYYRIREEYKAVVAGPLTPPLSSRDARIPPGWNITRESPGYHLAAEAAFSQVNPEEYLGLFLTGGRAPEYSGFRASRTLEAHRPRQIHQSIQT